MAPTLSIPAGPPTAGQYSIPPSSNGHKPAPQSVRLFVGGLPADITVAELQSRFKPFGTVLGMEVVPQKDAKGACRGFAYVDLDPISEASLHKCFTVYNGAKWRGGKLRVEKARATFLDRLKAEWDAEKEALDSAGKPVAEAEKEKPSDGRLPKAKPIIEPLRLKWGSWEFEKRTKVVPAAGGVKVKKSFRNVPEKSLWELEGMGGREALSQEKVTSGKGALATAGGETGPMGEDGAKRGGVNGRHLDGERRAGEYSHEKLKVERELDEGANMAVNEGGGNEIVEGSDLPDGSDYSGGDEEGSDGEVNEEVKGEVRELTAWEKLMQKAAAGQEDDDFIDEEVGRLDGFQRAVEAQGDPGRARGADDSKKGQQNGGLKRVENGGVKRVETDKPESGVKGAERGAVGMLQNRRVKTAGEEKARTAGVLAAEGVGLKTVQNVGDKEEKLTSAKGAAKRTLDIKEERGLKSGGENRVGSSAFGESQAGGLSDWDRLMQKAAGALVEEEQGEEELEAQETGLVVEEGSEKGSEEGSEWGSDESADEGLETGLEKGAEEGSEEGLRDGLDVGSEEDVEGGSEGDSEGGSEEGLGEGSEGGSERVSEEGLGEGSEGGSEGVSEESSEGVFEEGSEEGLEEGLVEGSEEGLEENLQEGSQEAFEEGLEGQSENADRGNVGNASEEALDIDGTEEGLGDLDEDDDSESLDTSDAHRDDDGLEHDEVEEGSDNLDAGQGEEHSDSGDSEDDGGEKGSEEMDEQFSDADIIEADDLDVEEGTLDEGPGEAQHEQEAGSLKGGDQEMVSEKACGASDGADTDFETAPVGDPSEEEGTRLTEAAGPDGAGAERTSKEEEIARQLAEERKKQLGILGAMFPDEARFFTEAGSQPPKRASGFVPVARYDPSATVDEGLDAAPKTRKHLQDDDSDVGSDVEAQEKDSEGAVTDRGTAPAGGAALGESAGGSSKQGEKGGVGVGGASGGELPERAAGKKRLMGSFGEKIGSGKRRKSAKPGDEGSTEEPAPGCARESGLAMVSEVVSQLSPQVLKYLDPDLLQQLTPGVKGKTPEVDGQMRDVKKKTPGVKRKTLGVKGEEEEREKKGEKSDLKTKALETEGGKGGGASEKKKQRVSRGEAKGGGKELREKLDGVRKKRTGKASDGVLEQGPRKRKQEELTKNGGESGPSADAEPAANASGLDRVAEHGEEEQGFRDEKAGLSVEERRRLKREKRAKRREGEKAGASNVVNGQPDVVLDKPNGGTGHEDGPSAAGPEVKQEVFVNPSWRALVGYVGSGKPTFSLGSVLGTSSDAGARPSGVNASRGDANLVLGTEPEKAPPIASGGPSVAGGKDALIGGPRHADVSGVPVLSAGNPSAPPAAEGTRSLTILRAVGDEEDPGLSFVRSETAEQEWLASKSALSIDYKRKKRVAARVAPGGGGKRRG